MADSLVTSLIKNEVLTIFLIDPNDKSYNRCFHAVPKSYACKRVIFTSSSHSFSTKYLSIASTSYSIHPNKSV